MAATVLANALAALMFATTGPDTQERRFVRLPGEKGDQVLYYYGYHANDWLAMVQGAITSFHFRRQPDSDHAVDAAPQGRPSGVPRHMPGLTSGETAKKLPKELMREMQDEYIQALNGFKPPQGEVAGANTTAEDSHYLTLLDRRMGTRLAYLSNVPRRSKAFREACRLPDMSEHMLDSVLKMASEIHGLPKVHERDHESQGILNMLAVTDRNGEQSEGDELKSSLKKVKGVVVRMKELSFKGVTAEEDRNLICNYMNHLVGLLEHKEVSSSAKMAIRRMLSLSSFDGHMPQIFCLDDNVSSFMDPAALREQVSAGERDSGPVSEAAPNTLGAEQAELLRRGDPDGGLLYMYYTFEYPKCRIAAPLKRSSMVQWHLGRSPVMTEIAKEVAENMKSKKRTLVVVNDPFCQQ